MMGFAFRLLFPALMLAVVDVAAASEFSSPWREKNTSIVLDAYEFTPIDWSGIPDNRNLVGFINKASDGLPPKYRCPPGDNHCRTKWRRYSVTKELYHTRRILARALGLKWGAYHLARPNNPIQQAQHFLRFAKPDKDDLIALDIEHNNPKKWMSLKDAETFARYIKKRVGRYPVLYTNHVTARYIATNRDKYRLLSRLNLWYARYRPSLPAAFPMGNWDSYTLWQFSSMVNCSKRRCLKRINGAGPWIDVNVAYMSPEKLRAAWPLAELTAKDRPVAPPKPDASLLVAKADSEGANAAEASAATKNGNAARSAADALVAGKRLPKAGDPLPSRAAATVTSFVSSTAPKWRPDAVIVRRVASLFSDDAHGTMKQRFPHVFVPREIRSSDDARGTMQLPGRKRDLAETMVPAKPDVPASPVVLLYRALVGAASRPL